MSRESLRRAGLAGCLSLFTSAAALAAPHAAAIHPDASVFLVDVGQLDDALVGTTTTGQFFFYAYGGSVTVNSVALSGANGSSYSISKNTCAAGTVITTAGTSTCEVDVLFAPQTNGLLTESLTLGTSAGDQTFDISASGLLADLLVSPTQIDFGFQAIGTESATRTLTFKNPNPIAVTVPTDANPPLGDFYPESGSCETIPANGSCSYQIEWTPHITGAEVGYWYVVTGYEYQDEYQVVQITFTGEGVQDGSSAVTLPFNTTGISNDGGTVQGGGLDGDGNVYSGDFLQGGATWSGQTFVLGYGAHSAVHQATLTLPTGQYYGATLLATGVNGNQVNQAFTVTYSDGTTSVLHQSLSDWKTPQHYVGEAVAVTTAYRLTVTGATHTGPYYLYAYTLPFDPTKTAVSLTLPKNPNVEVLALNVGVAGVPVTADLSSLFNVSAVGLDGAAVAGAGIDQHGSAISLNQFQGVPLNELLFAIPTANVPDAVANVTVPLPSGQYSTLHLIGMAVEGNQPNQSLTVHYQDGTSTTLAQGFSDWHTSQKYTHESIAVAMTYKLNPDGSKHPGTYDIYQYDIPIDATKQVSSVVLPKTADVVILSVALKP